MPHMCVVGAMALLPNTLVASSQEVRAPVRDLGQGTKRSMSARSQVARCTTGGGVFCFMAPSYLGGAS